MSSVQPEVGDLPVDVCISHSDEHGVRQKHFFKSSKAFVETMVAWQQRGVTGIYVTWATTTEGNRRAVEAALGKAGVEYTSRPGARRSSSANRWYLVLGAFLFLLGPALFFAADFWGHDLYQRWFLMPDDPVAFEQWLQSKRNTVITVGVGAAAISMGLAAFCLRRIRRS